MIKAKTPLQITSLNLSNKELTEIPQEIFLCTNLKKLKLSNNQLTKIPLSICKLHKLEVLDLSNNKLSQLHAGIFRLEQLKTLVLSNNQIKSLPKQINNLKQLKVLILQQNGIESIDNLTILPNLEKLNINHNKIKSLNWLKDCSSLKSAWIGNNPIQDFQHHDLNVLQNLKHLFTFSTLGKDFNGNSGYLSLAKLRGNILHLEEYKAIINFSNNPATKKTKIMESKNIPNTKFTEDKKVFIVHGHNDLIKEKAARTLEKLGLEAIILHEQHDGGKTIIEKFEKNVIDVGFAIVLLTADDEGKAKRETNYKDRSRQNVVFEMGYFMGKLGRDRVLLLLDKDVEKPGDLDGIVYTPIDDHDAWKHKLVKEMKAVGYSVSADNL